MTDFFAKNGTEIFALINLIAVTFILPIAKEWLNQHINKGRSATVEVAIGSGLKAAINAATAGKSVQDTMKGVVNDQELRASVVNMAKDYVQATVPKAVDKLGINPVLEQVIAARVDDALSSLAQKYITINKASAVADIVQHNEGWQANTAMPSNAVTALAKSA